MKRGIVLAVITAAAFSLFAIHEGDFGNNRDVITLGQSTAENSTSRDVIAIGNGAAQNMGATKDSVLIGKFAANNCVSNTGVIALGHGAVQDSVGLRNVVAIGKYELAATEQLRNTTSINSGQILASETFDVVTLRTRLDLHPTNAPFCYMGGDTYIGGTGTTYISGNVVFNGRKAIVDNSSYGGGGSGTAKLAGSGDLANLRNIPYSSGDCHFFVSPNGSDSNNGSIGLPFLTIEKALQSVTNSPMQDIVIGVYAGEYAYPTAPTTRAATQKGITLVGLEGSDKTFITLEASGIDYVAATNGYLNTFEEGAVLIGGGDKWMNVIGFTFDGRTVAQKSYEEGSYFLCSFTACRFTGLDAVSVSSGRRYNRMVFSNCMFTDCIIDENFHVILSDHSGSENSREYYASPFFGCGFYNSIVKNIHKSDRGNPNVTSGNMMLDCEIWNSLIIDERNKWRTAIMHYYSSGMALEDSAVAVKEDTEVPISVRNYSTFTPYANRMIISVGEDLTEGVIPWGFGRTKDSFFCPYSELYTYVDKNIYPLDDAFKLFGIGYNNSLTRRFKHYLIEKNYQTKDNLGLVDKRNQNATVILLEDDDLNIYRLSTSDNTRPMLATFMSVASAYAPNERVVSTSLSQNEYEWGSKVTPPTARASRQIYRVTPNPDDNEEE